MKTKKIFVFGLDGAGKTVLINYLITEKIDTEFHPIQANLVREFETTQLNIEFHDAPGHLFFRKKWLKTIDRSDLLIFVIDASNKLRFQETKREFLKIYKNLNNLEVPMFVIYNKMDKTESKENLDVLKKVINFDLVFVRKIYKFQTSVYLPETISELRNQAISILSSI
jgi:small GTP-binding protein